MSQFLSNIATKGVILTAFTVQSKLAREATKRHFVAGVAMLTLGTKRIKNASVLIGLSCQKLFTCKELNTKMASLSPLYSKLANTTVLKQPQSLLSSCYF